MACSGVSFTPLKVIAVNIAVNKVCDDPETASF